MDARLFVFNSLRSYSSNGIRLRKWDLFFGVSQFWWGMCVWYRSGMGNETTISHRSFSQFTSWLKCGKAFQLERMLQVPATPAWYFVGGSAFHAAAEKFLKETDRVRS